MKVNIFGIILIVIPNVRPTPDPALTSYSICGKYSQFNTGGYILSPDLAGSSQENLNCSLEIKGDSSEVVTIRFEEFAIEGNAEDQHPNRVTVCGALLERNVTAPSPCCLGAMLRISELEPPRGIFNSRTNKIQHTSYCSKGPVPQPFLSYGSGVNIQFISNGNFVPRNRNITRKFRLRYLVSKIGGVCENSEFQCLSDGKCLPKDWHCNNFRECSDSSDERDCGYSSRRNTAALSQNHLDRQPIMSGGLFLGRRSESHRRLPPCGDKEHFPCGTTDSSECFEASQRCDRVRDCSNGFDEAQCGSNKVKYTLCKHSRGNATRCAHNDIYCYERDTQRCNGVMNCPRGEDELGCNYNCSDMIPCGSTCGFRPEQRCNGIDECPDGYDEDNCPSSSCGSHFGSFLCNDGRCISEGRRCDRVPDCSGAEDELYCIKNSVITAAIMGSLVCGILVVIAISCICRLYAMRPSSSYHRQQNCSSSHSQDDRLRRPSSISDPEQLRFDALQDLYCYYGFRDPPPPYTVAVGGEPPVIPPPPSSSGRRRRSRLHHQRPHTRRSSINNGQVLSAESSTTVVPETEQEVPEPSCSMNPTTQQNTSPKPSTSSQENFEENVAAQQNMMRITYEQLVKGSDDSSEMSSRISDEIEFTVLPSSTHTIAVGAEATSPTSDEKPLIAAE